MKIHLCCSVCDGEEMDEQGRECPQCGGEGSEEVTLPTVWEICGECHGDGTHVHNDLRSWSESDIAADPDDFHDMMAGKYDVKCQECNGSGKVRAPDINSLPESMQERIHAHWKEEAYHAAEVAAERRMGA